MTPDEERFGEIEARVLPTLKNGVYSITTDDWGTLTASRLAWKFTAKAFSIPEKDMERAVLKEAVDRMGWPEIHAFKEELRRGQDIREDAGGFWMRALRRLFGLPSPYSEVTTYQDAAKAMVEKALS